MYDIFAMLAARRLQAVRTTESPTDAMGADRDSACHRLFELQTRDITLLDLNRTTN